jgi:hypothetical protein
MKVGALGQVECFLAFDIPSHLVVMERTYALDTRKFGLEVHDRRIRRSDRAVEVSERWKEGSDRWQSGKDRNTYALNLHSYPYPSLCLCCNRTLYLCHHPCPCPYPNHVPDVFHPEGMKTECDGGDSPGKVSWEAYGYKDRHDLCRRGYKPTSRELVLKIEACLG